tara:strand:- start:413232 stop:413987 length:756 start_codon:yes stop_codon:yes gene_type:complete
MKQPIISILFFFLVSLTLTAQYQSAIASFDKVIVSPHIAVKFQQGAKNQIQVESITVNENKLHVEVEGKTLRVYLEGAKEYTKNEKQYENGHKKSKPLYHGTVVKATITYQAFDEVSLRGEERFDFLSPINQNDLRLKIYGESQVYFHEVNLKKLQTTIYGQSVLEFMAGHVVDQKFTAYGESNVNALNIKNQNTKLTAYGEGSYQFNVSEKLKVTAYGEATVVYKGTAELSKGIVIGDAEIAKLTINSND